MNDNSLFGLIAEGRLVVSDILSNNGEITPEIESKLVGNQALVADKVDRIVFFLDALQKEHEYFSEKAKEFQKMSLSLRNSEARFKDYLKSCLAQTEDKAVYGIAHKISTYRFTQLVKIESEERIPDKFKKVVTTYEIDKERIKEALLKGEIVPGACLRESNALKISINRKKK